MKSFYCQLDYEQVFVQFVLDNMGGIDGMVTPKKGE